MRARQVRVVRKIPLSDAISQVPLGWAERIERGKAAIARASGAKWLAPSRAIGRDEVATILGKWHDALRPFTSKYGEPPRAARIITDRKEAFRLASTAANAAYTDASDAAADADADAYAYADDAADDADDADTVTHAAYVATADAADAADAANDDARAASAAASVYWRSWWYVRPQVYRIWHWTYAGLEPDQNPARWMFELWRLGLQPIGYVRDGGEVFFAIYHPSVEAMAKKKVA